MQLKNSVERAFGYDGEERILRFLRERELAASHDEPARWDRFFEKCVNWRKEFLLWEQSTYIKGVHGWNLHLDVCRFRLPKQELDDWTEYLYRMTLLVVVNGMDAGERNSLKYSNLDILCYNYYVSSGYTVLMREQWLEEINTLLWESWDMYHRFPGYNPAYHMNVSN